MGSDKFTGRQCRPCEIFWGTIGVTAGFVLLFMGADLLTGGWLARMISGGLPEAPVIPLRSDNDSNTE
jgi:hypothetical protein